MDDFEPLGASDRYWRGMAPSPYRSWKMSSLKWSVRTRGLEAQVPVFIEDLEHTPFKTEALRKRQALITILNMADQKLRFPRFLNLPVEVRMMIYEFHFDGMATETAQCPRQPPITYTNAQVRNEALPAFYRSFRFGILMIPKFSRQKEKYIFCFSNQLLAFLSITRADYLSRITKLRIKFDLRFDAASHAPYFDIDLKANSLNGHSVRQGGTFSHRGTKKEPIRLALEMAFAKIATEGIGREFFFTLRQVMSEDFILGKWDGLRQFARSAPRRANAVQSVPPHPPAAPPLLAPPPPPATNPLAQHALAPAPTSFAPPSSATAGPRP